MERGALMEMEEVIHIVLEVLDLLEVPMRNHLQVVVQDMVLVVLAAAAVNPVVPAVAVADIVAEEALEVEVKVEMGSITQILMVDLAAAVQAMAAAGVAVAVVVIPEVGLIHGKMVAVAVVPTTHPA